MGLIVLSAIQHRALATFHHNAMDVAVSPDSSEGQALMAYHPQRGHSVLSVSLRRARFGYWSQTAKTSVAGSGFCFRRSTTAYRVHRHELLAVFLSVMVKVIPCERIWIAAVALFALVSILASTLRSAA